jgi:hypothetical protein
MNIRATKEQLEKLKLRLEIETSRQDLKTRRKLDDLQIKKLEQEITSLVESIEGSRKFEPIRVWAPALSLFLSFMIGAATLWYQNYKDHELRVSQEMVKLIAQLHDRDVSSQISAAFALGLFGKGVEPVLVKELSSGHTEEFYRAIPDALLSSVQNGNSSSAIVRALLTEIVSVSVHDSGSSEVIKIRRAEKVLNEVLLRLSENSDKSTIDDLRSAVERSHSKVRDSLKDAPDKNTSQQIISIIDA